MALWHCFVFISLFGAVSAEGWEEFADNFATDLVCDLLLPIVKQTNNQLDIVSNHLMLQ
jgi:hypothetical protein